MREELYSVLFGQKQEFPSFSAYFIFLVDASSQFLFGTGRTTWSYSYTVYLISLDSYSMSVPQDKNPNLYNIS